MPMGLLDKTNPRATRGSVIRCAIFGAVGGPLFVLFVIWAKAKPPVGWGILLFAAIFGAAVSALVEWQLDDGTDEDDEKNTEQFDR